LRVTGEPYTSATGNGSEIYVTESVASAGSDVGSNLFGNSANAYYDRGTTTPPGTNVTSASAGFKDSAAEDFDLVSTSPAIDMGDSPPASSGFSAPTEDIEGTRRDIDGNGDSFREIDAGAYEFGFVITISKAGTGFAEVASTSHPGLILCGGVCVNKFDKGIDVTLEISKESEQYRIQRLG